MTRAEADRMLSDPSEVSPTRVGVSRLLHDAARLPPASGPSPALLTTMVDAVAAGLREPVRSPWRRTAVARVAAGVTVGLALTATGAAAATGSLPDTLQDGTAAVVDHIGIDLPDSTDDRADDAVVDARPPHTHGTVSDIATDPATSGEDKGTAVSEKAQDDDALPAAPAHQSPTADTTEGDRTGSEGDRPAAGAEDDAGPGSHPAPQAEPPPPPTGHDPPTPDPGADPSPHDAETSGEVPPEPAGPKAR